MSKRNLIGCLLVVVVFSPIIYFLLSTIGIQGALFVMGFTAFFVGGAWAIACAFTPPPNTYSPKTAESDEAAASREKMWKEYEAGIANAKHKFETLLKLPDPSSYDQIRLGEYPREDDEVWVEAYSGEPGLRHDDLVGFIILKGLRDFLNSSPHIYMFYREAFKQGCEFPVGSSAIKFARRRKSSLPEDQTSRP